MMGGEGFGFDRAQAAAALSWWVESGVDTLIQDAPRQWLTAPQSPPSPPSPPQPAIEISPPMAIPADFESFRQWLAATPDLPMNRAGARRVLPLGTTGAPVMLLADMASNEDGDRPIGGDAWELTARMLAAIGIAAEEAYLASLSCMTAPAARLSADERDRCAELARRHIALAAPQRLILFGDGPSKALVDAPLVRAHGKIHKVEGVRTIVTFPPAHLLKNPNHKALAWRDLLLLIEED